MISKNQIKYIASLHLKKNRDGEKLFFVEGAKMVNELLNSSFSLHSIYALEEWGVNNSTLAAKKNVALNMVSEAELKKISSLTTPQQVLALVAMPAHQLDLKKLKDKLTLVLDDIKDPGNLGTIIRIADWFGIENIICSENTVDVYNPKVVQASMGSLFRVNVHYHDLAVLLHENLSIPKLPVYGALMNGASVYDAELSKDGLLVLGNESEGIRKELMTYIDHALTIPSFAAGNRHAESLNVAVASAIICSEFRRRN